MSVLTGDGDGGHLLHVKGAPDVILELSTHLLRDGRIVPLTDEDRRAILDENLRMADQALRVLAVAYRLAPEHPFPAALDDATEAYRHLLSSGYEPRHIAFAGESAGGGLIYCLGQRIKELGLPLPAAMVGISPWTDLTFTGASYKTNAKKDPSLNEAALRRYAKAYADGRQDDPLVSPAFGDYNGFPPALILAGGNELLLSDSEMLAARLVSSGCRCELHVEEGLWHVYVLFGIPEARAALDKITEFLELWA